MANKTSDNIHILVVDDDQEMREFLSAQLAMRNFRIDTASSGGEAIEKIRANGGFDLAIMDLKMPLMDGISCLETVKGIDPSLQVIMISGEGTLREAVSAVKKGAYDFLEKPLVMESLLFHIEKALEKRKLDALISLYESGKAVFSQDKLGQLLESAMDLLTQTFRADEGSFMLVGPANHLYIASSRGLKDDVVYSTILKLGERVAGLAAQEGRSFLLAESLDHYPEFKDIEPRPRIRSSIIIPVYHDKTLVGVLNLNRVQDPESFKPADLWHASAFAAHIARAIEEARLYRDLEEKMSELRGAYAALEQSKNLLTQKEKLAALGTMVMEVAHEINNPLTSVMGYTDLLLQGPDLKDTVREHLTLVYKEADRCRVIVQDLMKYAKRHKPNFAPVDIRSLLEETLKIMGIEMRKCGVRVRTDFDGVGAPIPADADQLKQVFMNLFRNAMQALEAQADKEIRVKARHEDGKVQIEIADNGPGISGENLSKIFSLFFTTKDKNGGTGLGLSISGEIIRDHGGRISAQSPPGKGASFIIELPTANPAMAA